VRHEQQEEGNIIIIIAVIAAAIAIPASMADKTGDSMMEKSLSGNFVGVGDGIHNAEGVAKVIPLDGSNNDNILRLGDLLQVDKRAGPVRVPVD
jgi:hypothetical protein